jgi:hypothetical protein
MVALVFDLFLDLGIEDRFVFVYQPGTAFPVIAGQGRYISHVESSVEG